MLNTQTDYLRVCKDREGHEDRSPLSGTDSQDEREFDPTDTSSQELTLPQEDQQGMEWAFFPVSQMLGQTGPLLPFYRTGHSVPLRSESTLCWVRK